MITRVQNDLRTARDSREDRAEIGTAEDFRMRRNEAVSGRRTRWRGAVLDCPQGVDKRGGNAEGWRAKAGDTVVYAGGAGRFV